MSQGQISDDGLWRWDGQRWVPNRPQQPPPGPPNQLQQPPPGPPKKSNRGRNIAIGCGGALAALVALIVILVAVSGGGGSGSGSGGAGGKPPSSNEQACSPVPCGKSGDATVHVSNLNRDAPAGQFSTVEPGNHLVTMDVTFKNNGSSELHANPTSFVLKDSSGAKHTNALALGNPSCQTWSAVNLTKGASFGPKPLCFQATGDPNGDLTLVWTKGINDVNIPLK